MESCCVCCSLCASPASWMSPASRGLVAFLVTLGFVVATTPAADPVCALLLLLSIPANQLSLLVFLQHTKSTPASTFYFLFTLEHSFPTNKRWPLPSFLEVSAQCYFIRAFPDHLYKPPPSVSTGFPLTTHLHLICICFFTPCLPSTII